MTAIAEPGPAASAPDARDLTGRDRMVWNVCAGWAGHAVLLAAGFIMPRQMRELILKRVNPRVVASVSAEPGRV
jgi:hypothetical protein